MSFGGRPKEAGDAAPPLAPVLPLIPLALVLLHIGPGVVLDVALLVAVFALLRVSILRSAMRGAPFARREPIEPIPAAAQTFAPSEVGGS